MYVHTLIFGTHVYMYMHVCNACVQCSSVMHFGYYALILSGAYNALLILCTCMYDQKNAYSCLVPYWFGVSLSELCVDGISVCMYVCNACMYMYVCAVIILYYVLIHKYMKTSNKCKLVPTHRHTIQCHIHCFKLFQHGFW